MQIRKLTCANRWVREYNSGNVVIFSLGVWHISIQSLTLKQLIFYLFLHIQFSE